MTKGQLVWLWGNAIVEYVFRLAVLLDASSSRSNVPSGDCVMSVTLCGREATGERDALFIECRKPAADAPRRRRDRSRI